MRRGLIAVGLLFLAACADPAPRTSQSIDERPATSLEEALSAMAGEPVVVNFWATWCAPCRAEMPHLVDAARTYEGRVRFLGVNVEDDVEAAAAFAEEFEMPFRSIADPDGTIRRDEKLLGLPATQFYDAAGELSFMKQGEIKADELTDKIEELLRTS